MSSFILKAAARKLAFQSLAVGALVALSANFANAALTMGDYSALPRSVESGVAPLVMLALSNDHQLYFKAYTDYDDLDSELNPDGTPNDGYGRLDPDEITYSNNSEYVGYFSSSHCYTYDNGVFKITSAAVGENDVKHYCQGASEWSGNFLNWATMTRIDILLSVLYGGKRVTPEQDIAILERSYLPNDAHSFAKFYNGLDLERLTPSSSAEGLTMCNTTLHTTPQGGPNQTKSKTNTNPPLMRVIEGNYSLWASGERYQCLVKGGVDEGISESDRGKANANDANAAQVIAAFKEAATGNDFEPKLVSPNVTDRSGIELDYIVRVEACPSEFVSALENCQSYGDETPVYKPVGILHTTGEDNEVLYGLISGSYTSNKQGGFLRKNISGFGDEINRQTGQFNPNVVGIVSNLNAFRIAGWQENNGGAYNAVNSYDNLGYNEDGSAQALNADYCRWSQIGFSNGHCVDWGNPFGEILAEGYRYFAGLESSTNSQLTTSDEGADAPVNVKKVKWEPLDANKSEFACANMNVIGLNTSAQTFDKEIANFTANIPGANDINNATDSLLPASQNPLSPDRYFFGTEQDNPADLRALINCEPKVIDNLSEVSGACPEAPGLEGTWNVAGLSKIVAGRHNTTQVEGDQPVPYDLNTSLIGDQVVKTHGVQLASALPIAKIKLRNNRTLLISPACENWGNINPADEGQTTANNGTIGVPDPTNEIGSFAETPREFLGSCALVDFKVLDLAEDSKSGAFYVNWEDSEQGGDFDQDMHGILSYSVSDDESTLRITTQVIGQSTNARLGFGYTLGGLSPTVDKTYIHSGVNGYPGIGDYKYNECNDNIDATIYEVYLNRVVRINTRGCGSNQGASSLDHTISATGSDAMSLNPVLQFAAEASDGQFVGVTDPKELKTELSSIIGDLGPTPIAGGGQVAASSNGAGSKLYLHSTYFAQLENDNGDRINWVGQIGALFIDNEGNLREDTPGDDSRAGELDANDLTIRFLPRVEGEQAPRIQKFKGETPVDGDFTFADINYIWNTTTTLAGQAQRKIYTSIPKVLEADSAAKTNLVTIDSADLVELATAFADDNANIAVNERLLGLPADVPTSDLVAFIQGTNTDGKYRSRTLGNTTYLLGDVLTSPVIQGAPDYTFTKELNDPDYINYQTRYKNDAKIAYVAANDGLIHAFYAAKPSGTSYPGAPEGSSYAGNYPNGVKLGDELWAYAPFNLLPHLQWLANPRYSHVPYFDGYVRTFDVKIFPSTGTAGNYPGGWGTILVVGTGRGAGAFDIDLGGTADAELTTRPAYIVLDITERGKQPKLIAEISHEQLGFTTGEPDVARFKDANGNFIWHLVFGSGPRGTTADSTKTALKKYVVAGLVDATPDALKKPQVFAFNLADKTLTQTAVGEADDGAFIGGINSMDWNRDFKDDALYFGTVAGDQATPSGQLFRAQWSDAGVLAEPVAMLDVEKPIVSRPLTVIDYRDNYWVFAGTGRFYVRSDSEAVNSENLYVGLKDPKGTKDANGFTPVLAGGTFNLATDLFNTTNVTITNAGVVGGATDSDNNALTNIDALRREQSRKQTDANGVSTDAWRGWYFRFGADERQHTSTGYLASTLFFSTTVPGTAARCDAKDKNYIYVIDMRSGVFSPYYSNSTDVDGVKGPEEGEGIAPEINSPADVMNMADGSVEQPPELEFDETPKRHSWREVTIPW